jgi:hypothetical protein
MARSHAQSGFTSARQPFLVARRHRKLLAAIVGLVAIADTHPKLRAATVTSTWTGTTSSAWSNSGNWSPAGSPQNSASTSFDVIIPARATQPTLDVTTTISLFTLNATATLSMQGSQSLTVASSTDVDNGTIIINSNNTGNSTLTFNTSTLSGAGTIVLNSSNAAATLAGTLTTGTTNTISGFGTVYGSLTNHGLVNANVSSQSLFVAGSSVANTGTMQSTSGTLVFTNAVIVKNTGGVIAASSNNVMLTYAYIDYGMLTSSGGNAIVAAGSNGNILGAVTNQGTLNIVGGSTVTTEGSTTNNGTINVDSNGTSTSELYGGGTITGTGTVNIDAGGLLQFAMFVGGSSQGGLSIASGGKLDLNNNHMFINYGSGPDPIASIAAWIATGYKNGAWTGNGITSSAAQANAGYGVGFADSADPGNPAGLSSGQIEIMYTLLGDANLDGKVNGADFAILATNFNKAVTGSSGWDQGDFNYDGKINGADFAALAANFNKGASGAADVSALSAFAQANGLTADVPEPAIGSLFALATLGLLAARRNVMESISRSDFNRD